MKRLRPCELTAAAAVYSAEWVSADFARFASNLMAVMGARSGAWHRLPQALLVVVTVFVVLVACAPRAVLAARNEKLVAKAAHRALKQSVLPGMAPAPSLSSVMAKAKGDQAQLAEVVSRQDISESCVAALQSECSVDLMDTESTVPCVACYEGEGEDLGALFQCLESCCETFVDFAPCFQNVLESEDCNENDQQALAFLVGFLQTPLLQCSWSDCLEAVSAECDSNVLEGDYPCSDCANEEDSECLDGCCGDFETYLDCAFSTIDESEMCTEESVGIVIGLLILPVAGPVAEACGQQVLSPACREQAEELDCAEDAFDDIETCAMDSSVQDCCERAARGFYCFESFFFTSEECQVSAVLLSVALLYSSNEANEQCANELGQMEWDALQTGVCVEEVGNECGINFNDLESFPCAECGDDDPSCYQMCCPMFGPVAQCAQISIQACTPSGAGGVISNQEFSSFFTMTSAQCMASQATATPGVSPTATPVPSVSPGTATPVPSVSPGTATPSPSVSQEPTPTPVPSGSPGTPTPTPSDLPGTPTPTPTPSSPPEPTPTPVCIDAEWIEARGLEKVHASDGVGELLCITGLEQLPCGTRDHVLEVTVDAGAARMRSASSTLRTYEEVCAERECTIKVGRFNGVLHGDAHKLPIQDGHRLTTVSRRGTVWSGLENRIVVGAQKLESVYVNRAMTYLQRRNSAMHLSKDADA
ncbi:Cell surface glycoprotein 1 [Porphyridium purpureum]|uniref:Cell surface glycoprotein 1 n=1 Tax=Porphyridium purpureum TaxID=35688 RepID=A0A5J4Z8Q1_PORPP|nr:Cell surface glycoprotein 1 [Porphyridium purpureum]|eukprot:POR8410..scf295_1